MQKLVSLETQAASLLVDLILASGLSVSVFDGEEWTLKRSTSGTAIKEALETTGEDYLKLYDASGTYAGWLYLVWGNSAPELVADYSANETVDAIWNEWHKAVDQ
jgi:hypothetical protein